MDVKIGLVLSGGMGKGAYQIGAMKAISEYFAPSDFDCVSAASIGSINAYAFLTGGLDKAEQIWKSVNLNGSRRFITHVLKSSFLQDTIDEIYSTNYIATTLYVPLLNLEKRKIQYHDFSKISNEDIKSYLKASIAMPFYNKYQICTELVKIYLVATAGAPL